MALLSLFYLPQLGIMLVWWEDSPSSWFSSSSSQRLHIPGTRTGKTKTVLQNHLMCDFMLWNEEDELCGITHFTIIRPKQGHTYSVCGDLDVDKNSIINFVFAVLLVFCWHHNVKLYEKMIHDLEHIQHLWEASVQCWMRANPCSQIKHLVERLNPEEERHTVLEWHVFIVSQSTHIFGFQHNTSPSQNTNETVHTITSIYFCNLHIYVRNGNILDKAYKFGDVQHILLYHPSGH